MMRRVWAVAALVGLLGLLGLQPASAAKPTIIKVPKQTFSQVVTDVCQGFDVRWDYVATQNVTIIYPNGTLHGSGSFNGSLTRINSDGSDDRSVVLHFSGSGNIDASGSVLTLHGPSIIFAFDDPTTPAWEGGFVLTAGTTVADISQPTINIVSATVPPRDICAELS